jgi:sugar/nucleoside kinase (ribokinase family)
MPAPDLVVVGQVTIDDVVPAQPGPWTRQIGGSSLYAVAGARLWLEPARIGVVACLGEDYPFDVERVLRDAGVRHIALCTFPGAHLVEWLIYEPDGSRRSLPRNPELLQIGAEGALAPQQRSVQQALYQRLIDKLLAIAPSADQVPAAWLPAAALHLCPQAGNRHRDALDKLRDKVHWISVDPSPHYARAASVAQLAERLHGVSALLPSAQDISSLLHDAEPAAAVRALARAGFAEVVLKRGANSILLSADGTVAELPAVAAEVVDPTGAGDAFCGAYAACRLIGHKPFEAVRRAAASAALVVGCRGVEAALQLAPPTL